MVNGFEKRWAKLEEGKTRGWFRQETTVAVTDYGSGDRELCGSDTCSGGSITLVRCPIKYGEEDGNGSTKNNASLYGL